MEQAKAKAKAADDWPLIFFRGKDLELWGKWMKLCGG